MLLGVNIDHVATLRQARLKRYPDLLEAALEAERGGADFITVHLREDRRHVQDADIGLLMGGIGTHLNLEVACVEEMVGIALGHRPAKACFVPERREEITTEGGLDVAAAGSALPEAVARLKDKGVEVSLFIDPDPALVEASAEAGADAVELHTGDYAERPSDPVRLERILLAAKAGVAAGLKVNAGHGLTLDNVAKVAKLEEISELNIGHAIVSDSVFRGLRAAVQDMRQAMLEPVGR